MNANVKIVNAKTDFLFAVSIHIHVNTYADIANISQSLNINFEYKKPRVIEKEKRCLNVLA